MHDFFFQIGRYECKCTEFWQGANCSQDIDECALNICQNNGTCKNAIGNFQCSCIGDFVGNYYTGTAEFIVFFSFKIKNTETEIEKKK